MPGAFLYDASLQGPLALPGDYEVRLVVDGATYTKSFRLETDPRASANRQDLELQFALHMQLRDSVSALADTVIRIRDTSAQLSEVQKQIDGSVQSVRDGKTLAKMTQDLQDQLGSVEDSITEKRLVMYADAFHYGIALDNKLAHLMDIVGRGADSAPSEQASQVYEELWQEAQSPIARLEALLADDLPPLNKRLSESGLTQIDPTRPTNDET